jgi:hypothetical protein
MRGDGRGVPGGRDACCSLCARNRRERAPRGGALVASRLARGPR